MSAVTASDVSFYPDDGHRLAATVYAREGTAPRLAIVGCPGWGGRRTGGESSEIWRGLAARLDCVILAFDHSGAGKSEGPRDRLDPVRRVRDTRSAVTFLSVTYPALAERIAVYGSSFGGAIATVAAATDERVRALVALATFASGAQFMRDQRSYWKYVAFRERLDRDRAARVLSGKSEVVDPDEIMERDPEAAEYVRGLRARETGATFRYDLVSAELLHGFDVAGPAARLRGRPSLFLHAELDTLMPPDGSRAVADAAGGRFVLLRGVTHHQVYTGAPLERILEESSSFLTQAVA